MATGQNAQNGRAFQTAAKEALERECRIPFVIEAPFAIGEPPKVHRFDLASQDGAIIVECKNYSWTATGNMPSAKVATVNEAVLYLSLLPGDHRRLIVMKRATDPRRRESLAEYYARTYRHLLGTIEVWELDPSDLSLRCVSSI